MTGTWEKERANLLVHQFDHDQGRRSWMKKDNPARLKFVGDCIRMVGLWERWNASEYKIVCGLEDTLSAIRNAEDVLCVVPTREVEFLFHNHFNTFCSQLPSSSSLSWIVHERNRGTRWWERDLWDSLNIRDLTAEDVQVISEELKMNKNLLLLCIEGERGSLVGDVGARHLSDALRVNASLLYLDIQYCSIGPEGARHISDALRENSTLLFLDIGYNQIGDKGARHISYMLRENSTLLYLTIAYCGISLDGVQPLSEALRQNSTLLYLFFSLNKIGPGGARHLSDALRENSTLLFLEASHCDMGAKGARHISDALRENSTLLYLNILGSYHGDDEARHLSDTLLQNSTLMSLHFSSKDIIDQDLVSQIKSSMKLRRSSSINLQLSFEECRTFLRSNYSVQSWASVRQDSFLYLDFNQLPPEMWGEMLGFLKNDISSLQESILVPDLRSGFYFPCPICEFSSQEIALLSMIPWIEGLFRQDRWTQERFYRLELHKPLFDEEVVCNSNREDSSEGDSDFEL